MSHSPEIPSDDSAENSAEQHPAGYVPRKTKHGNKLFRAEPVSFVRRSTKLSDARQQLWEDHFGSTVLDVDRGVADTSVAENSLIDREEVFGRTAPLVIDIGVGHGESTFAGAQAHPEWDFVAIEVYTPGLAKLLVKIEEQATPNIRAVEANAPEVLDHMIPDGSAQEVWIFFPDPWQKTKYHKRRIVQPKFIDRVARALVPGGVLRLATDWSHYAAHMRDVMEAHPDFTNLHPGRNSGADSPLFKARISGTDDGEPYSAEDAADPQGGWAPRFETRPITAFERKATKAGRCIFDLAYQRK